MRVNTKDLEDWRKNGNENRTKMQPLPCEVYDEIRREEQVLAKQRNIWPSWETTISSPSVRCLNLPHFFKLFQRTPCHPTHGWPSQKHMPRLLTVSNTHLGSKVTEMRARGIHYEYVYLVHNPTHTIQCAFIQRYSCMSWYNNLAYTSMQDSVCPCVHHHKKPHFHTLLSNQQWKNSSKEVGFCSANCTLVPRLASC